MITVENVRKLSLSELGDIITGGTPKSAESDSWGDQVDFVTPSDQIDGARHARPSRRLSAIGAERLSRRRVPAGATALTCIGSVGKVSMLAREAVTNQQINTIVARPGVADSAFLYYLIRSWSPQLKLAASGSATPIVNKTVLSRYTFSVPSLRDQESIGELLGALDDKIAVNEDVARSVNELGRELFQSALAVGAVGVFLADIVEHRAGKYLAKSEYVDGGLYFVYGSNSVMGKHTRPLFDGGFSVLAKIGSYCGALRWSQRPAWVNNNASGLVPRPGVDPWVARYAVDSVDMAVHKAGSGQPYIRTDSLMSAPVSIPRDTSCAIMLRELSERETLAEEESEALAKLRDALTPLLLSGRVQVKDAEKAVGDVL